MEIRKLRIPEVMLIVPKRFGDNRGFFVETWNDKLFREKVANLGFVQDNHSLSAPVGTIRGLHFQRYPTVQGKLVRVVRGSVFDVALDLRLGSPTYGQHVAEILTAERGEQLWVPPGFAHAFCTLEPNTEFLYKVTDFYSAADEGGVAWDDPDLGIDWPLNGISPNMSDRDGKLPKLSQLPPTFDYSSFR